MGSAASKSSAHEEGHLFQNSNIPISFSGSLAQKLEENTSTDSERELALESQVQERVAAELKKLRHAESAALAQTTYDLSKQNIAAETNSDLNSVILEADVQELKKKLQRSTQYPEMKGVKDVEAKQGKVIQCLTEKKGRSLDCKAEVDDFKTSVRQLQQEFIVKYS